MEKTTTFMRRGILAGLAAVCACMLSFVLTACGPSDEDQAKEALDAQLGQLVNPSDDTISKLSDEAGMAGGNSFTTLNLDSTAFVKSWLNGFSYELGDVKVDGNTATVNASITCKQLYVIMTGWSDSFESDALNQQFSSIDEVYTYAGKTFMDAVDGADPVTTQVTFTMEKDGGGWKYATDNTDNDQALAEALLGGGADASFFQN
jgi:hypothetical protein